MITEPLVTISSEHFGWMLAYAFLYGLLMLPAAFLVRFATQNAPPQIRYWCFLVLMMLTAALPCTMGFTSQQHWYAETTNLAAVAHQTINDTTVTRLAEAQTVLVERPHIQATSEPSLIRHLPAFWLLGALTTTFFVALGFVGTRKLCTTSRQLCDSLKSTTAQLQQQYPELQRIPV
jgi:hypothetical protein